MASTLSSIKRAREKARLRAVLRAVVKRAPPASLNALGIDYWSIKETINFALSKGFLAEVDGRVVITRLGKKQISIRGKPSVITWLDALEQRRIDKLATNAIFLPRRASLKNIRRRVST